VRQLGISGAVCLGRRFPFQSEARNYDNKARNSLLTNNVTNGNKSYLVSKLSVYTHTKTISSLT
jgi:hypothetical protein